jgi:hypothetical protein
MRDGDSRGVAEFSLENFVSPWDDQSDFTYVMCAVAYAAGWEGGIEAYYPHSFPLSETISGTIRHKDGGSIRVEEVACSLDRYSRIYRVTCLPLSISEQHVALEAPRMFRNYLAAQYESVGKPVPGRELLKFVPPAPVEVPGVALTIGA